MRMEITNYFKFRNKFRSGAVQVSLVNLEQIKSNFDLIMLTGKYDNISFPLIFKYDSGSKFHDTLNTGWPSLHLISEKMITILKENKLTGWKIFPVQIYDKKGDEVKGYYGLSVIGRCGKINYNKSQIIYKGFVDDGPITKQYKGVYPGLDTWDGSDFFLSKGNFAIYMTKKAKEVMTKAKLTNISFINLTDIEISEHVVDAHHNNLVKNMSFF